MVRKEKSVTAARIISKSFKLKHAREFMEEQFSRLGEEKAAYVSQGKQRTGKKTYTNLRKTYNIFSSCGIFQSTSICFALIQ